MTDITSNETFDRVVRSLEENGAHFAKQEQAKRRARLQRVFLFCVIFAAGAAVGALIATAIAAS